jgi:hypothetical protein
MKSEIEQSPAKKKYVMRVCNRLLIKLRMNGIDPTEAACFFGAQAESMLGCPPNFGPNTNKSKGGGMPKRDVWLMRGFYPGTPQMFKISMAENDAFADQYQYYVKVSEPQVRIPSKRGERGLNFTSRYETSFDSEQIREQLNKRIENEVLGESHGLDPLISNKVVFTPKCISPKGMPIYRLNMKKD